MTTVTISGISAGSREGSTSGQFESKTQEIELETQEVNLR